jgi:hypothetical protein
MFVPLARLALLCGLWAGSAHADVGAGLTPAAQFVAPGADFDVNLDITSAGAAFNGFAVVLSYDRAVLSLVPLVPSALQEGCLMTGGCSAACGTTFDQFASAGDSVTVSDVLFCNQVVVNGPGHLYKVRFHAVGGPQITHVTIRRATFYNGGLFVAPVHTTDMTVVVTTALAVGDAPGSARALRVEPNPSRGAVRLVFEDVSGGLAQVDILDLQGRMVRRLGPLWLGAHARVEWDGTADDGRHVAGGSYLARIRRGGRVEASPFVLLR